MDLITLLMVLIVIGVALYLIGQVPMDPAIAKIIRVVVILVVCLWLVNLLLGPIHIPIRLRRG